MKCPNCGMRMKEQAKFCGNCGQRIAVAETPPHRSRSTNEAPTERAANRGGRYAAPKNSHKPQKRKSNSGIRKIGLLVVVIIGLGFAFISLIGNILSENSGVNKKVPTAQMQEQSGINDDSDDKSSGSFLGLGNNKQTIYVVDGKGYYPSDDEVYTVYTYEFSEDGIPLGYHWGYSDNSFPATTFYYVFDYDGITRELVDFALSCSSLGEAEREKQIEKESKKLKKLLEKYIDLQDGSCQLYGIENDLIVAEFSGTDDFAYTNSRITEYNSQNNVTEQRYYRNGTLSNTQVRTYISGNRLNTIEINNIAASNVSRTEYAYGSGDLPISIKSTQFENDGRVITGSVEITYEYDKNGMLLRQKHSEGTITEFKYHYKKLDVSNDSLELLCNIYDYLGIKYIIADESTSVSNTLTEEDMAIATAEPVDWQGIYSLSLIQDSSGFYVKYSDGSFDAYENGSPLIWEGPDPMTYGADYTPTNLLMSNYDVSSNQEKIQNGELVLVCPYDNRVRSGIVPVKYSGMTMTRTNEDGKKEAVFLSKSEEGKMYASLWIRGKTSIRSGYGCNTINGIPFDEYGNNFSFIGVNKYQSLPKNEKYTLGIVSGAALVETEYSVDSTYFFQEYVQPYELKLNPTTDGYATMNFSGIPAGDYILYYSYWNEEKETRSAMSTYIVID